jgi:hypothetical protein
MRAGLPSSPTTTTTTTTTTTMATDSVGVGKAQGA